MKKVTYKGHQQPKQERLGSPILSFDPKLNASTPLYRSTTSFIVFTVKQYSEKQYFWFRYLDRIIRGPQLKEFSDMLLDHQKALTPDGMFNFHCVFVLFQQVLICWYTCKYIIYKQTG